MKNDMPERITAWFNKGRGFCRKKGNLNEPIASDTGIENYIRENLAVPRADVAKLVNGLKWAAEHMNDSRVDWINGLIAEFNAKHGDV
ncbi:hypothetical protein GCM10027347_59800 [Larkinella harenae]